MHKKVLLCGAQRHHSAAIALVHPSELTIYLKHQVKVKLRFKFMEF